MLLCQISDLHIKTEGALLCRMVDTAGLLRRCVGHIAALRPQPDALIVTGDLVDSGGAEEYAFLRELLAPLKMPMYLIPGNHDERQAMRGAFADHSWMSGRERIEYVINTHPLRIVALDTVIPGKSGGEVSTDSMSWLDQVLAAEPDRPTVVLMHHPPFASGIVYMDRMGLDNAHLLADVIARHPQVERVLCGHLHRSIQTRFAGTLASTCPSTAHQINLDLSDSGPGRFVMEPPGYQLHRWSPASGLVSHTVAIGEFDGPYAFR